MKSNRGGRFILGMGAGWHEEEYRSYGYDSPPAGVRVDQLRKALHTITSMWTQEPYGADWLIDLDPEGGARW